MRKLILSLILIGCGDNTKPPTDDTVVVADPSCVEDICYDPTAVDPPMDTPDASTEETPADAAQETLPPLEDDTKAACCKGLLESGSVLFACGVPPGRCRVHFCGEIHLEACKH